MSIDRTSVIIDQTMLCEAARFLDSKQTAEESRRPFRSRSYANKAERLFHLATLIDALVLYDDVYVLPATLPPGAETLPVRSHFIRNGTIRTLDTSEIAPRIGEEFRDFFRVLEPAKEKSKGISEKFAKEIAAVAEASLRKAPLSDSETQHGFRRGPRAQEIYRFFVEDIEGNLSHSWLQDRSDELERNAIATLGSHLMDEILYFGSGAITDGVSHLRTYFYWRASDHVNMPFLPSCRRIPQYEAIARQLRRTLETQIAQAVADAFSTTVDEVYQDSQATPIQLPPFLSLFLDKARDEKNFCLVLEDLRKDFEELRRAMAFQQTSLTASATIGDRLKAKEEIKRLIASLKKHHQTREDTTLDEVIGYAPEVLKPLSDPLNPTKYGAALILKPLDWIREWWMRRPFRLAYRLRDRLHAIASYHEIVENSLGLKIAPGENMEFQSYYDQYLSLYSCE